MVFVNVHCPGCDGLNVVVAFAKFSLGGGKSLARILGSMYHLGLSTSGADPAAVGRFLRFGFEFRIDDSGKSSYSESG